MYDRDGQLGRCVSFVGRDIPSTFPTQVNNVSLMTDELDIRHHYDMQVLSKNKSVECQHIGIFYT